MILFFGTVRRSRDLLLDLSLLIHLTGVYKQGNKFQAMIQFGGKQQSLGQFGTIKEAAIAWDLATWISLPFKQNVQSFI